MTQEVPAHSKVRRINVVSCARCGDLMPTGQGDICETCREEVKADDAHRR